MTSKQKRLLPVSKNKRIDCVGREFGKRLFNAGQAELASSAFVHAALTMAASRRWCAQLGLP